MTENEIATQIVDAAYKVHTTFGPGLLESVYEAVMSEELCRRGLRVVRQQAGQLRDGEDKDQVEEQLEAGNTAEVGGRRIRRPVCLH